jgi:hypothetical protein
MVPRSGGMPVSTMIGVQTEKVPGREVEGSEGLVRVPAVERAARAVARRRRAEEGIIDINLNFLVLKV